MLDLKVRERVGGGAWGEELDLPPTICVNNKIFNYVHVVEKMQ